MPTAKEVPALVAAHADYLQGMDYVDFATSFIHAIQGDAGNRRTFQTLAERRSDGVAFCQEQLYAIKAGRGALYHVPDDMLQRACTASQELPDDVLWHEGSLPGTSGAAVFETPLLTIDDAGKTMSTGMVMWQWQPEIDAGSISMYTDTQDSRDSYIALRNGLNEQAARTKGEREMPRAHIGRYQLSHYGGVRTGDFTGPHVVSAVDGLDSTANAGRILWSLFKIMDFTNFTNTLVDRRLRRRGAITPDSVHITAALLPV